MRLQQLQGVFGPVRVFECDVGVDPRNGLTGLRERCDRQIQQSFLVPQHIIRPKLQQVFGVVGFQLVVAVARGPFNGH